MFIFMIFMTVTGFIQVPPLINEKRWRELAAYSSLWLIGAAYGTLELADAPIPSPVELIIMLFGKLSQGIGG